MGLSKILAPLRFGWCAMRGHRFRPWRSPYLRWRIETYTGIPAGTIDARAFWKFFLAEKGELLRFLLWTAKLESYKNN